MKHLLVTTLLLLFSFSLVQAQQDTTLDELISTAVKAAEIEELDKKEEERTKEIANLLGFVLPEYIDNPSYVITFTDPSPDNNGVEIELDKTSFKSITSPYTLPALSIGEHSVIFRFYDKDGNIQLLEYELVIIPRAPIISSPQLSDTSVTVSGTALSNSEIIYRLTSNAYNDSGIVKSDENGDWSITITPEAGLTEGIYTFSAYTRKYGYASNLTDPITFGVGEGEIEEVVEKKDSDILFSFSSMSRENFISTFKDNRDLLLLVIGTFIIGFLLALLFKAVISSLRKDKKEKMVEDILKNHKGTVKEEKTLKELLGGEEEEKDKKEEPSIINKDVFLKKYRNFDPDNEEGKEHSSKRIKKNIKVSLTSKEG